jgi:hypothetical protein
MSSCAASVGPWHAPGHRRGRGGWTPRHGRRRVRVRAQAEPAPQRRALHLRRGHGAPQRPRRGRAIPRNKSTTPDRRTLGPIPPSSTMSRPCATCRTLPVATGVIGPFYSPAAHLRTVHRSTRHGPDAGPAPADPRRQHGAGRHDPGPAVAQDLAGAGHRGDPGRDRRIAVKTEHGSTCCWVFFRSHRS